METEIKEQQALDINPDKENGDDSIEEKGRRKGKKDSLMAKFFADTIAPPSPGEVVEGPVIAIEKSRVFIDLAPFGVGIIYGREFLNARDVLRKTRAGDRIAAKVIEPENKAGYIELSLKEARQARIWNEAEEAIARKLVFDLPVKEANKGGLLLEWQGIQGFLPASQLKSEHYPRVEDGDKEKIFHELQKLIGEKLSVSIITADPMEGKLIFSEKDQEKKEREKIIDKYQVGDVVEGEVTGAVDFGLFVKLEEGLEGLVHISEIDWGLVDDPKKFYGIGSKIRVKIIEIKDGKVSLSIKALKENPWEGAAAKYKKGDAVKGVIIKYNKHGALASIEEGVAGLIHISEFGNEETLRQTLELGKVYPLTITLFEPKEQRMTLSLSGGK